MPNLKENLKTLMDQNKWNGREVARRASLDENDIYNILNERSKKPSAEKVDALARAFNVDISSLLHGTQPKLRAMSNLMSDGEEWDALLYNDSATAVREALSKIGKIFLSRTEENKALSELTMRVYTYAKKRNELKADRIFADDIVAREYN